MSKVEIVDGRSSSPRFTRGPLRSRKGMHKMSQETSEVARLLQEIEQRAASARLIMEGYAEVASHEVIQRKMNEIGYRRDRLEQLVGTEEAGMLFVQAYCRGVEGASASQQQVFSEQKARTSGQTVVQSKKGAEFHV